MAHIKARKHALAGVPRPSVSTASATTLALAALIAPLALRAQTAAPPADPAMPEVRVKATGDAGSFKADTASSPKFTAPLVDTPQTISVIRRELIQQQGGATLTDALRNTPGITMLAGENGNTATGDAIFMRGFDTQGSIYVDGIRDLGTFSRDMFNIEQVEVVKGPSGSDNGRGTASGYINLVSKQPSREAFTSGSASIDSAGQGRLTADVNRGFGGDLGGAWRLNVMKTEGGVEGRDEVRKDRWAIAPSVALGLGTPTRIVFSALHSEQHDRPDGGIPTVGLEGFFNQTLGDASEDAAEVDKERYYGSQSDHDNVIADMLTARIEHDLRPNLRLRNITRWGRTEQRYLITGTNALGNLGTAGAITDPSTWTVARTRQRKYQENEIFTNQTNLTAEFATGSVQHTLSTGVEVIHEKQNIPTYALPTGVTQTPANLYDPSSDDAFETPERNGAFNRGDTTTVAVYAFDTMKLSEQWQVLAGARFERFHSEYTGATITTATSNPELPVGTLLNREGSLTDNLFSWKVGAVYKPAPNGSIYAAASTSFLPPGGANFQLLTDSVNANNPNLDPQEASNFEIGTKWDVLDQRLALTAAVFRSQNKNEIVTDEGNTESLAIGKRTVKGVELGAVGQITPAWQVSTGLAYMDPEITRGSRGGDTPTDGGVIQWTPKFTFTSWTSYRFPFGLTVGGGARYVDTVRRSNTASFATPPNGVLEVPDYWVFDAMAAYELTKNVALQLNVYNLADEDYVARLNNGGSRYYRGTPRSAMLTANVQF